VFRESLPSLGMLLDHEHKTTRQHTVCAAGFYSQCKIFTASDHEIMVGSVIAFDDDHLRHVK